MSLSRFACWTALAAVGLVGIAANADDESPAADMFAQGPVRRDEAAFRAIYAVNRDGTNVRYLIAAPGMISSSSPDWAHDGKLIAFEGVAAVDDVSRAQIFVYALEGPFKGPVRKLGYGNTPAWSPNDRHIAFMLNGDTPANAQGGVWLMDADGGNRRWLANGWYPRWAPDGKRLVCHAWLENGKASLFIVDVATGASRPLFQAGGWELSLYGGTWSPAGNRIVFVGSHDGHDQLATIDPNGGEDTIRVLYRNEEAGRELFGPPVWSPDGRQIIFGMQQTAPGPRQWWDSYLYSIAADVRSGPVLLEGRKVGHINRGMAWSPDSKQVIFSSER
jgi:hypothetical protein